MDQILDIRGLLCFFRCDNSNIKNILIFRKYILEYLRTECHKVYRWFSKKKKDNNNTIHIHIRKERNKCVKLDIIITYLVTGGERKFSVKWGT